LKYDSIIFFQLNANRKAIVNSTNGIELNTIHFTFFEASFFLRSFREFINDIITTPTVSSTRNNLLFSNSHSFKTPLRNSVIQNISKSEIQKIENIQIESSLKSVLLEMFLFIPIKIKKLLN